MTTGPTYTGNAASASIDLSAIGDAGLEAGKTFSPPVIGALVISACVGAVFAWGLMSSYQANQLIEIQQADAARLRDSVKPKVAAFTSVAEKITKLNATTPDFELSKSLAGEEFAIAGSILASVSIPLPGMATDNVANFAADTVQLRSMLADHNRYTNDVDKQELLQLMEDNKAVTENEGFGIVINPQSIAEKWDKDDYRPQMGTLVGFKKVIDETKKVEIAILPAGDIRQVPLNEFIPIDKAQILKAGGQNAMQRYSYRVRNIKFQANKIGQYTEQLMDSLEKASGGMVADAAPEAPKEEPAAEAPAEPAEEPAAEPAAEEPAAEEPAAEE